MNDRADIARLAGAAGVHVGQDDLTPAQVRAVVGPGAIVGLSTHTSEQLDRAVREPIDYLAIGPVFGTDTKATGYDADWRRGRAPGFAPRREAFRSSRSAASRENAHGRCSTRAPTRSP